MLNSEDNIYETGMNVKPYSTPPMPFFKFLCAELHHIGHLNVLCGVKQTALSVIVHSERRL